MAKLFIGYALRRQLRFIEVRMRATDLLFSGLAWHTDDQTLRSKFEEFGSVEEAVRHRLSLMGLNADNRRSL